MSKNKTKEKNILKAAARTQLGKANRRLRKDGFIPANIFGPGFKSLSLSVGTADFIDVYKIAGETEVIYISLDDKEIPTLVSELQYHPLTESILHITFRQVNLKQKITAQVPLKIVGASEAVEKKNGVLLTQMEDVSVEALPTDIPHEIAVDISRLTEIGQMIHVSDLPKESVYEIKEDPEKIVISVTEHKEEELEPETVSEEPEILTAKTEEGATGETEEASAPAAPAQTEKTPEKK